MVTREESSTSYLYPVFVVFSVSLIIPVVASYWQDHEGEIRDRL